MADGKKTGGRKTGTPNKLSSLAKDNIAAVFNRLGGTSAMAKWAAKNPTQFYQIYAKLLPVDLKHSGGMEIRGLADVLAGIGKRSDR